MNNRLVFLAGLFACVAIASGQPMLMPRNAESVLYFPHLNEGGPNSNNFWQMTFTFVNSNPVAANLNVSFYNDDGSPMMIDFGSGPVATLTASVPAFGSSMFRSQLTHKSLVWGWAAGQSDAPVFCQLNYRNMINGQVAAELAANPTTGTALWTSTANADLGIAVANPSPGDTMTYTVDVKDAEGKDLGSKSFQLAPHGHDAFTLNGRFTVPQNLMGSVSITGQTSNQSVYKPVVWTVGSESGVFATLPDGRALMPEDQMARAMRVFGRVMAMAHQLGYKVNPQLTLLPGTASNGMANAMGGLAANGTDQVTMYMSLVEMAGDSDGELAFLMAHEIAHVIQCRMNGCKVAIDSHFTGDYESDADEMGMMLSTSAGYDSYCAAAVYSKLQMGNGQTAMAHMGGMGQMGSVNVWEDMMSNDPRGFFAGRINNLYTIQQRMCGNPQFSVNCQAFKSLMHPSTGGMLMPM